MKERDWERENVDERERNWERETDRETEREREEMQDVRERGKEERTSECAYVQVHALGSTARRCKFSLSFRRNRYHFTVRPWAFVMLLMTRLDVLDLTNRERLTRNNVSLSFFFFPHVPEMYKQDVISDDVASIAPSQKSHRNRTEI